jgi:protein-arginine kinase activator protein McsA
MEKENLIKYLVSWTRILKNESKQGLKSVEILESQLLVAVAEENYEKAVEIRNQIYELS